MGEIPRSWRIRDLCCLTIVDRNGQVVSNTRLPNLGRLTGGTPTLPTVIGVLGDHVVTLQAPLRPRGKVGAVFRDTTFLAASRQADSGTYALAAYYGLQRWQQAESPSAVGFPFGKTTVVAIGGDRVSIACNDELGNRAIGSNREAGPPHPGPGKPEIVAVRGPSRVHAPGGVREVEDAGKAKGILRASPSVQRIASRRCQMGQPCLPSRIS